MLPSDGHTMSSQPTLPTAATFQPEGYDWTPGPRNKNRQFVEAKARIPMKLYYSYRLLKYNSTSRNALYNYKFPGASFICLIYLRVYLGRNLLTKTLKNSM